jgi:hypothetical protein
MTSRKTNTQNEKSRTLVTFSKKKGVENKVIKFCRINGKISRKKTEMK